MSLAFFMVKCIICSKFHAAPYHTGVTYFSDVICQLSECVEDIVSRFCTCFMESEYHLLMSKLQRERIRYTERFNVIKVATEYHLLMTL